MKLILLPGMDGTGDLFAPIVPHLSDRYSLEIISYPRDRFLDYTALIAYVKECLPTTESYLLLAESFSGTIAYQIAQQQPDGLKGVIFVSTFLENPRPLLGKLLPFVPMKRIFGWRIPKFVVKRLLLDMNVDETQVSLIQQCIAILPPDILYQRLQAVVQLQQPRERIELPCIYLQASHDHLVPKGSFASLAEWIPHIVLHEVSGGHLLLQSNPEECVKIINDYLPKDIA